MDEIKYKDEEEKVISLNTKKGYVVKTNPEIGKEVNEEEVTIYVSRLKLLPIILIILITNKTVAPITKVINKNVVANFFTLTIDLVAPNTVSTFEVTV